MSSPTSLPGASEIRGPQMAAPPPSPSTEDGPNIDHLITEDDTPVDNYYSMLQRDLFCDPLGISSVLPRPYIAMANVGVFKNPLEQATVVPDFLLSLGVAPKGPVFEKRYRSYFYWEYHKAPELGAEIVSNTEGGEDTDKLAKYASLDIRYYVIWDPAQLLANEKLRIFVLRNGAYVPHKKTWFPEIGLGVKIWQGDYRGLEFDWLRWVDKDGVLLPTGEEQAETLAQERSRADKLAEKLRSLGVDPKEV